MVLLCFKGIDKCRQSNLVVDVNFCTEEKSKTLQVTAAEKCHSFHVTSAC